MFWDISAILKDLQRASFPICQRNVLDLLKKSPFGGDSECAMTTDLSKPCLLVKLDNISEWLIDGNHRLYKAGKLKCDNIPCYVLPE